MTDNSTKGRNNFRIIAGEWRSRRLKFPAGVESLRPTPDRIRETLFNWLQQKIVGAQCLDLFAGSGALAFEAGSRGASNVTAVDISSLAINAIRDNCRVLDTNAIDTVNADSMAWLKQQTADQQFGIIFLDPPYSEKLLEECCDLIAAERLLAPGGIVYLESDCPLDDLSLPSSWHFLKNKQAGKVYFGVCAPSIKQGAADYSR